MFLSDELGPTLETLDFTIRIRSTPTFLYFDMISIAFVIYLHANAFLQATISPFLISPFIHSMSSWCI